MEKPRGKPPTLLEALENVQPLLEQSVSYTEGSTQSDHPVFIQNNHSVLNLLCN